MRTVADVAAVLFCSEVEKDKEKIGKDKKSHKMIDKSIRT